MKKIISIAALALISQLTLWGAAFGLNTSYVSFGTGQGNAVGIDLSPKLHLVVDLADGTSLSFNQSDDPATFEKMYAAIQKTMTAGAGEPVWKIQFFYTLANGQKNITGFRLKVQ